jgi:hypothetical protein
MSKIAYFIFSISVCLSLLAFRPKCIIIQDSIPVRDTLKVDYNSISFPSDRLILKYYNQYYSDTNKVHKTNRYFRTVKLNIAYDKGNPHSKIHIASYKTGAGLKTLYRFTGKDTLAFDAIFSCVKYYGEYYIIIFPKQREWMDFIPPKDARGNFLYTPIVFHFDTVNLVLTKLKFNPRLKVQKRFKEGKVMIYDDYKYSHQFDMGFAFSKKRREFVFKASDK